MEKIIERIIERPLRRRLPDTRRAVNHKFDVGGHEGYINVGLYEDGRPGEVFITMAKEGSTVGGLMDTIATLISLALQYGVPLESLVRKFEHMRFEPAGMTRNPEIPFAKSLVDYIFRWLAMEFVTGTAPPTPHAEAARAQRGLRWLRPRPLSLFPAETMNPPPRPSPGTAAVTRPTATGMAMGTGMEMGTVMATGTATVMAMATGTPTTNPFI